MRQDTPYRDLSARERDRELVCMREVLSDAAPPKLVYEAFGGIGMTAALMAELWPKAKIRSWDLDLECVAAYRARGLKHAEIRHGDTRAGLQALAKFDAATLDFNQFTIMDFNIERPAFQRSLLRSALLRRPKWLQVTDSACSRLHLNWRNYNLPDGEWETYVGAVDRRLRDAYGYAIVRKARHRNASYFRLEPC